MELLWNFFFAALILFILASPFLWWKERKKRAAAESRIGEAERLSQEFKQELENLKKVKKDAIAQIQSEGQKKIAALKSETTTKASKMGGNIEKLQIQLEAAIDATNRIANHFANDSLKFIISKVTSNNYETSKKRLDRVFTILRKCNVDFPKSEEAQFINKLKDAFKAAVRKEEARLEQQRIKEQIRDEQRAERERQSEMKRLEDQERAISIKLEQALKEQGDKHSEEIDRLKAMLEEAHSKSERAKSQAQLTKAGHVYVISNLGSFGENIYKVGMTRRLEPMDRVKELGDASVPFPFDVHMMISCDDAPSLEVALHKELNTKRVNRVNLRKEFFSVELEEIKGLVEKHHGSVDYVATAEALEYNESILLTEQGSVGEYSEENEDFEEDDFNAEIKQAA